MYPIHSRARTLLLLEPGFSADFTKVGISWAQEDLASSSSPKAWTHWDCPPKLLTPSSKIVSNWSLILSLMCKLVENQDCGLSLTRFLNWRAACCWTCRGSLSWSVISKQIVRKTVYREGRAIGAQTPPPQIREIHKKKPSWKNFVIRSW